MVRTVRIHIAVLLWLCAQASLALGAEALVFGVYPFLSPSQIVEQYAPLRDYLAETLGRPVNMVSAPDFASFIDRTRQGDYDIVFTAPHMGRLAEKRDGWRRLAQTGYQMEIVVVTPTDGGLRHLRDLRGKSLALGARHSMTYQIVNHALSKQKLVLDQDVRVVDTASFSNVLHGLVRGEADAGATSKRLLTMAPDDQRAAVRILYAAPPSPGFLLLLHPRLDASSATLRKALFRFAATPSGSAFFDKSKLIDFRPIDDTTMRRMDPYTTVLSHDK